MDRHQCGRIACLWRRETDLGRHEAEKLASPIVNGAFSPKGDYIVAKLASGHVLPTHPGSGFRRNLNANESSTNRSKDLPFDDWFGPKASKRIDLQPSANSSKIKVLY